MHECRARRMRRSGHLDRSTTVLAGLDSSATTVGGGTRRKANRSPVVTYTPSNAGANDEGIKPPGGGLGARF